MVAEWLKPEARLFGMAHFLRCPFWSGPFWHKFHENIFNFFSIFNL